MELQLRWPSWIGIVAEDLEGQRAFYRDVLGLREGDSAGDWVEFEMDAGRVLEVLAKADVPQYAERRVQVGFEVEDIRSVVEELERRGVERISELEQGPDSSWCYFRDPEGNVFEVTQRGRGAAAARQE